MVWGTNSSTSSGILIQMMNAPVPQVNVQFSPDSAMALLNGAARVVLGIGSLDTAIGFEISGIEIIGTSTSSFTIQWPGNVKAQPGVLSYWNQKIEAAAKQFVQYIADQLKVENPWKALGLAGAVSREEAEAAYRKRAKETHPDFGGNHDDMVKLNQSWEIIKKTMGWE